MEPQSFGKGLAMKSILAAVWLGFLAATPTFADVIVGLPGIALFGIAGARRRSSRHHH
jgi:hypothetical protein